MRSQASKTLPKKGAVSKTAFKARVNSKQVKKKLVAPKKIKNLVNKNISRNSKKLLEDATHKKDDEESSNSDKSDGNELAKAGPSKAGSSSSRSGSPIKKGKKDQKDKKESPKVATTGNIKRELKKCPKKPKTANKPKLNKPEDGSDNDEVKYKINSDIPKKVLAKVSKAKVLIKKTNIIQKKKITPLVKPDNPDSNDQADKATEDGKSKDNAENNDEIVADTKNEPGKSLEKSDDKEAVSNTVGTGVSNPSVVNQTENSPKVEVERPPKFFTSSRPPRTVDIDVKCCKNSKGNLSVSERFISMKCETKTEETNKDKTALNTLISPGPEIDVYTFTEKVDSPKTILSGFRSPVNKNVGRVRPIARVKGTVIDKKEVEKKKYSPHRPIEEVVKQLKAKKGSEELNTAENNTASSLILPVVDSADKDVEDKPKPIVSKSYKMVARKSSITGKPFSPIKFLDQEPVQNKNEKEKASKVVTQPKKCTSKPKKQCKKSCLSDEDIDTSKFALNTKTFHYTSSDESHSESNDDNDTKDSSGSDSPKSKKTKTKKYKRITDGAKKNTSKELKELSKDSLIDLKDESILLGGEKPSKRRLKLLSMWSGPKKHRMASLNAIAKVHCLYENESRTHMELGLMKTIDRTVLPSTSKVTTVKKRENKPKEMNQAETTSESEYDTKKDNKKEDSSESSDDNPPQRSLRGVPGIRSAGKYWDPKSSTSSSEDSELESKKKTVNVDKKKASPKTSSSKSDTEKTPAKMKKTAGVPVKKKRNRNEVVMDLKDMVVQKRMASLNATAILAASYEKRSPKSSKDDTTSDSCSDESFSQKPKNGASSGVKSEKAEEPKKEKDDATTKDRKQKVEVIVNQDTDVTITGVYSTHHHEGFCTVSGMQYRISSTSHTQTTATANCDKESCSREDGARYTPLSALSSMQPPAEHAHPHPHSVIQRRNAASIVGTMPQKPFLDLVTELGGLARRAAGCSAFSAPSPAAHHESGNNLNEQTAEDKCRLQSNIPDTYGKPLCPCSICDAMPYIPPYGYYQPAGPLIKESGGETERALTRYHPPPHYHAPHPPVLQQYGPYYPSADLCYQYYRPPGRYHPLPPQPDAPMVGVGSDTYPPPQYYGQPPCYQHAPQRYPPYVEYRGCPCPLNACPKNVLIGPVTGKPQTGGGPADVPPALAPPGGAFRAKVRACALDAVADTHGSGKDPPLEPEPPAAADAPHPCPVPAIGGASPKREFDALNPLPRGPRELPGSELGPPSPARGSAGACAPQPPPSAPRRARLGKAMARRSLVGDDTGLLLQPQPPASGDGDDDVVAIEPPLVAPIDLSSSDERPARLVDVKKENDRLSSPPRIPDAKALRDLDLCPAVDVAGTAVAAEEAKVAVKRRHSRPKLEIEMKDVELEDARPTNGIGEHVKLQKRRKVSSEQETAKVETVTREPKKKVQKPKRPPKTQAAERKSLKRKSTKSAEEPEPKKAVVEESPVADDPRLKNVAALPEDTLVMKSKTTSAVMLDNLLRKNSIDRLDAKGYDSDKEINPVELFFSPNESIAQTKKTLNINNNIVDTNGRTGTTPVSQIIGKKLTPKSGCKIEKIDSKITHNLKTVLKSPTEKMDYEEEAKVPTKGESDEKTGPGVGETETSIEDVKDKIEPAKDQTDVSNKTVESAMVSKPPIKETGKPEEPKEAAEPAKEPKEAEEKSKPVKRCKLVDKSVSEKVKLFAKVIKTDEAASLVEEACASPTPSAGRGGRRRRRSGPPGRRGGGLGRRGGPLGRRAPLSLPEPALAPRAPPRWSNGWTWDGEDSVSKVYLNNDSRLDRTARCWSRMTHASGDRVARGDCVLLRASPARAQPFVARVARLWENPDDGEMMVSLVWYYRPEHTHTGRQPDDAPDEVFASRHRDANSVACIEDKCYVLTFNEYCRYRKRLKALEEGVTVPPSIVPPMPAAEITPATATNDSKLPPTVSPELVLFCRKIYDFRSKKLQVPNK